MAYRNGFLRREREGLTLSQTSCTGTSFRAVATMRQDEAIASS